MSTLKILNFLSSVLSFFRGDETAIKRFFEKSKERRGLKAFSNSLIALEEGENDKAFSEAKKAEKLLRFPQMTALLGARATRANGLISSEKEYGWLMSESSNQEPIEFLFASQYSCRHASSQGRGMIFIRKPNASLFEVSYTFDLRTGQ